jgi:hypothetical protein
VKAGIRKGFQSEKQDEVFWDKHAGLKVVNKARTWEREIRSGGTEVCGQQGTEVGKKAVHVQR